MPIDLGHSGRPKDCFVASLHHLELDCSDPAETGAFYHRALAYDLSQQDRAAVGCARDRHLIFVADKSKTLVSAGCDLPDADELARLRQRIRKVDWRRRMVPHPARVEQLGRGHAA